VKIGIVSGGFDPIHVGHIRYLQEAKRYCDRLVVILNGDSFLIRKKGYNVFSIDERREILEAIKYVDYVHEFESDKDDVGDALIELRKTYFPTETMVFMKGGDRSPYGVPIPEIAVCGDLGVQIEYGIGGYDKPNSSSWVGKEALRSLGRENGG